MTTETTTKINFYIVSDNNKTAQNDSNRADIKECHLMQAPTSIKRNILFSDTITVNIYAKSCGIVFDSLYTQKERDDSNLVFGQTAPKNAFIIQRAMAARSHELCSMKWIVEAIFLSEY